MGVSGFRLDPYLRIGYERQLTARRIHENKCSQSANPKLVYISHRGFAYQRPGTSE